MKTEEAYIAGKLAGSGALSALDCIETIRGDRDALAGVHREIER